MKLSTLHVIHLYDYQKPEDGKCPVQKLKKTLNPLILSTCMRHLYLFSSEQLNDKELVLKESLEQIRTPYPHQKMPHCDYFQGEEAYEFLLFWVIGGLSPKKPFADERILGDLRKTCNKYESSASPIAKEVWKANKLLMLALLLDSKYLVALTKKLSHLPIEEKRLRLKEVCKNCVWARTQGFMNMLVSIDYEMFLDREKMLTHLMEKLEYKKNTIYEELLALSENKANLSFFFSEEPRKLYLDENLIHIERLRRILIKEKQDSESISKVTLEIIYK
ncbi:hypothetical protein EP47_04215 [Legionella norrlandica]|uniref:Uncharacterized protein n=1 Tax=Legionella norrlandica TaxID=1498499 RepID=A0A0A2SSZ9_9GAMM|nr:hypothetical protein [Legionella norrlandica]KGP64260.1 hypothetical protein EP47_04215 [Legionella norrlandica]